jgi:hypothetical protein
MADLQALNLQQQLLLLLFLMVLLLTLSPCSNPSAIPDARNSPLTYPQLLLLRF